jgi:hypothetical protein
VGRSAYVDLKKGFLESFFADPIWVWAFSNDFVRFLIDSLVFMFVSLFSVSVCG